MRQHKKQRIIDLVEELHGKGQYTFTKDHVTQKFPALLRNSIDQALGRLIDKGRIAKIVRDLFVIVPVEYRQSGAPPANWYIDDLMKHLNIPYYVGLLSAAALQGAGHQQPQEFQIVVPNARKAITVGRSYIQFYMRKNMRNMPTELMKVPTGTMNVATPETTAMDLVDYPNACGSWNNVFTTLQELQEELDANKLLAVTKYIQKLSSVQRLGYLLDLCHVKEELTDPMHEWLESQKPRYILFDPSQTNESALKDIKWHLLINSNIESDL